MKAHTSISFVEIGKSTWAGNLSVVTPLKKAT